MNRAGEVSAEPGERLNKIVDLLAIASSRLLVKIAKKLEETKNVPVDAPRGAGGQHEA